MAIDNTITAVNMAGQVALPTYKLSVSKIVENGDDGELYVSWTPVSSYVPSTEKYEYKWKHTKNSYDASGKLIWTDDTVSTTTNQYCTYTPPQGAKKVVFKIRPIQKEGANKFGGQWSTEVSYDVPEESREVETPPVPTVTLNGVILTVEVNINYQANTAEFQIARDDVADPLYFDGTLASSENDIRTGNATRTLVVKPGSRYKARCRVKSWGIYSKWSDWSANTNAPPATPSGITKCEATSSTSIYVEWAKVDSAESYTLEYTEKKSYFDSSDNVTSKSGITVTNFELTGLESGKEYFFRVKAVNDKGDSGWSDIKSVVIGKGPVAPTTWSSTTTAILGETVMLYWVHNAEDGSAQTYANLELDINGTITTHKITGEDSKWSLNTSSYAEGAKVKWRVQTAGITKIEGEWSTQRTIDIYAPPTLEMQVTDSSDSTVQTLSALPLKIKAEAGPSSQTPIMYRVSVVANQSYETEDDIGDIVAVNAGQAVYSKYIDPSVDNPETLELVLSAAELILETNIEYSVICSVTMNSGLTAEARHSFTVGWDPLGYSPNAAIGVDPFRYTASIRPFCEKPTVTYYKVTRSSSAYTKTSEVLTELDGDPIPNARTLTGENVFQTTINGVVTYYCIVIDVEPVADVLLSVYRRGIDGSFTEIATDLDGAKNIVVTDPHPGLDYARYRIVAVSKTTSEVSYSDIPGIYIGGNAIIIQWDEAWTNAEQYDGDVVDSVPMWNGSMVKLPYNIDTSTSTDQDVEFAEYIGRSYPVGYYGTQLGHAESWSAEIPKDDTDTLYGLRKLQSWLGNVYVREPSGTGYWANVKVSFNKKHKEVTIPVTIEVKRVEGGV